MGSWDTTSKPSAGFPEHLVELWLPKGLRAEGTGLTVDFFEISTLRSLVGVLWVAALQFTFPPICNPAVPHGLEVLEVPRLHVRAI